MVADYCWVIYYIILYYIILYYITLHYIYKYYILFYYIILYIYVCVNIVIFKQHGSWLCEDAIGWWSVDGTMFGIAANGTLIYRVLVFRGMWSTKDESKFNSIRLKDGELSWISRVSFHVMMLLWFYIFDHPKSCMVKVTCNRSA